MMYDIFKVEDQTTRTGKQLKRLIIQKDGDQYPMKNVTMWNDHPLFNSIQAGQTHNFEIYESDSGVPNPKAPGRNYLNRTVSNPNSSQSTQTQAKASQNQNITELAIKTHIDRQVAALRHDLKIIADYLGVGAPKPTIGETNIPYPTPEEAGIDPSMSGEIPDDLDPEDIPF